MTCQRGTPADRFQSVDVHVAASVEVASPGLTHDADKQGRLSLNRAIVP
ncbi:hypothetical protein [Robbsia sp. KACC 23696]